MICVNGGKGRSPHEELTEECCTGNKGRRREWYALAQEKIEHVLLIGLSVAWRYEETQIFLSIVMNHSVHNYITRNLFTPVQIFSLLILQYTIS